LARRHGTRASRCAPLKTRGARARHHGRGKHPLPCHP